MGFQFKLDSVLSYTASNEEKIKQEYVNLQERYKRAEDRLGYLRNELLIENDTDKLNISYMILQSSYKDRVKKQLEQQKSMVEALDKKVQSSKAQMIGVMQERKTLENLKEKHKQNYITEQAKLEQKLLDEQALLAFFRN